MSFNDVVSGLRDAERELQDQLDRVRNAIDSLGGTARKVRRVGRPAGTRKRRRLSAKARAAISAAQKARWAKLKAGKKK